MTTKYTKAKFWKCALQVNPYNYIKYRGTDHQLCEEDYNRELLRIALENNVKVIGLADHGNVDQVDAIRKIMNDNDIVVFPGFEIASTEKAHFVCLFPEDTPKDQLNRYLGALDLTDASNGVRPSNLGAKSILSKVETLGGFVYAAHSTDDNGILRQKLVHVWVDPMLKAAQIPNTVEDLRNDTGNCYRQILLNKNPDYRREQPIAIINAKDIEHPQTLADPKASCLIKMTKPSFEAFKLAFLDPVSRVRLNSDVSEKYYSRIENIKITGGYLDGVDIDFSEHLNAVIGGRGTGKSTLLECIRYALHNRPIGKNAQKQHEDITKENLGKSKARIELVVRSSRMNGKLFTIARRYGENASVKDELGSPSHFTPKDLLPDIEIFGQNEIHEIAKDKTDQHHLLLRFLDTGDNDADTHILDTLNKLADNRKDIIEAQDGVHRIEDEVERLPKLEEEAKQYRTLGLDEKLKIVPLLEQEKQIMKRATSDVPAALERAIIALRSGLPDISFLEDAYISKLPHVETLQKIRVELQKLNNQTENAIDQWQKGYNGIKAIIYNLRDGLQSSIEKDESDLEEIFKGLPSSEGKTGKEIGIQFQNLVKEIERIRPHQKTLEDQKTSVAKLYSQRKAMLDLLSSSRADRCAKFERSMKALNRRLLGKIRLTVKPEADRTPIMQFFLDCKLDGIGEGRLSWVKEADDFSPVKLAEVIRNGAESLRNAGWSITPVVAEALARLTTKQILQLEELELPDLVSIELNVAHQGQEQFKPLEKLSTGQQCTAILHLLLLQNLDPLLMDQPEDNLDNAFIADRIVDELRTAKITRQFIFATHNANIPVFGDAEWIGVFEAQDSQAQMPPESQGAIDVAYVRDKAADILEGGKTAFIQRKDKYGF